MMLSRAFRRLPAVTTSSRHVLPLRGGHGGFAVNQEEKDLIGAAPSPVVGEPAMRVLARATWNQLNRAGQSRPFQQLTEGDAALPVGCGGGAATLQIDLHPYHRGAPPPPFAQSWPRRKASSQCASAPASSRSTRVCPSSFSHTSTLSGVCDRASMMTSE